MTAEINRSVAEKAVCWCDGRRIRSSRAQKLGPDGLALWAAGGGIRLRFYTLKPRLPAARRCDFRNSVAVMFELRCSEFELGCSESADQRAGGCQGSEVQILSPRPMFPSRYGRSDQSLRSTVAVFVTARV